MNQDTIIENEKVARLLSWYNGKKCGPLKIDIEMHRRCNLECLSCSRRNDPKFEHINEFSETIEMPPEKWLSIVDQAAELGVMQWHVAGGGDPPMLAQTAFPVMQRIKHHGMYGILTTNGTNLPDDKIKLLVDIGWDRIHFSIDGADAETHDYLRVVPGTFNKATAAIRKIRDYRNSLGKIEPMLNMNTVLSVKNYNRLHEQVELAHNLGIEYMFIEPLIVYSKWGEELKIKEEHMADFRKSLDKAIELTKKYNIDNNFSRFDRNLDEDLVKKSSSMNEIVKEDSEKFLHPFLGIPCYDPWYHMTIKCDGRVISCDVATDEGDNIREKALKEIWFGPYFTKHRKMLFEKNIPDFCRQCNPSHTTQRRRLREEILKTINRPGKRPIPFFRRWLK